MIPKKIIDNSNVKLSIFLNDILQEIPNTHFDIATAFFNIQAYALVKDNIQGVKGFWIHSGLRRGTKGIFFIANMEMIFISDIFMTSLEGR